MWFVLGFGDFVRLCWWWFYNVGWKVVIVFEVMVFGFYFFLYLRVVYISVVGGLLGCVRGFILD